MEYVELHVKENESFRLSCMVSDGIDKVLNLSALELRGQMRTLTGYLYTTLVITATDPLLGSFICELPSNISLAANTYFLDITFQDIETGITIVTSTMKVVVDKGITI